VVPAAEYRGWGDRKSFPALFFCGQSVVAVAISAPLVPVVNLARIRINALKPLAFQAAKRVSSR
jgi:hypothetical protein